MNAVLRDYKKQMIRCYECGDKFEHFSKRLTKKMLCDVCRTRNYNKLQAEYRKRKKERR